MGYLNHIKILALVSHLTGEPEGGNGLRVGLRLYVELTAQHFDNGLTGGQTEGRRLVDIRQRILLLQE